MHCVQRIGKPHVKHSLTSATGSYNWIIFVDSSHNSQEGLTNNCTVSKRYWQGIGDSFS